MTKHIVPSQELLAETFCHITDAVILTEYTGRITWVSPGSEAIFGYSKDDIAHLGHIENLFPPDTVSWELLNEHEQIQNIFTVIVDNKGTEKKVLLQANKLHSKDFYLFTIRDITPRVQARKEFISRECRVNAILNKSDQIIAIWDKNGICIHCSSKSIPPVIEQALSQGCRFEAICSEPALTQIFNASLFRCFSARLPDKIIYKDLILEMTPVIHPEGNVDSVITTFVPRVRDENAKTFLESLQRNIEHGSSLMILVDLSQCLESGSMEFRKPLDEKVFLHCAEQIKICAISNELISILGIRNRENIKFLDLFPPTSIEQVQNLISTLMSRAHGRNYELELLTGSYQPLPVEAELLPITDAASMSIIHFHDISELLKARKACRAAQELKSRFLAQMSHELRTPLTGILGMLELALDFDTDPEQETYLENARQCSMHLQRLINDILEVSMIEDGQIKLEPMYFQPMEILESITSQYDKQSNTREFDFVLDFKEPYPPDQFFNDPYKLTTVLTNILDNAFKFTVKGAVSLTTSYQADTRMLVIEIKDSGCGISDDELEFIFEHFSQTADIYTREQEGTGLGLTICNQLITMMKGDINVESQVGTGSTFTISVPSLKDSMKTETTETIRRQFSLPEIDAPEKLRILLVEDNKVTQVAATKLLESAGHTVVCVENGRKAVNILNTFQEKFDLVLMDLKMPVMDGFEATQNIRETAPTGKHDYRKIPIIAITATTLQSELDRFIRLGGNAVIIKPFQRQLLLELVQNIYLNPEVKARFQHEGELFTKKEKSSYMDFENALQNLDQDRELLLDIIKVYCQELPALKENLFNALQIKNEDNIKKHAHSLKGASGNVGAARLQEFSLTIEKDAAEICKNEELRARIIEDLKQISDKTQVLYQAVL